MQFEFSEYYFGGEGEDFLLVPLQFHLYFELTFLSHCKSVFQGLCVLQTPRGTSVTRRAAGLPMLILGVLAAEESSTSHPLLAQTISTLLEIAGAPLPQNWDQTLDLPQVHPLPIIYYGLFTYRLRFFGKMWSCYLLLSPGLCSSHNSGTCERLQSGVDYSSVCP